MDYDSFTFSFYKPGNPTNLLISMDSNCRIHRGTTKLKSMGKSHNLLEFIKAYIVGGKVEYIKQVDFNRIVEIKIVKDSIIYFVIIRLWGGFPNIIITKEDYTILHLHKKSPKRDELPGKIFIYPETKPGEKTYQLKEHDFVDYNSFIEAKYIEDIENNNKKNALKKAELSRDKRIKDINTQIKKLTKRLNGYSNGEYYKLQGDLILSNLHLIKKGDRVLTTTDYISGQTIEIPLNPELKPDQNSNFYYKKYKKSIDGYTVTKELISKLKNEETLLMQNPLDIAPSLNNVTDKPKKAKPKVGLHYNSGEWEIVIGRSAKENETLLRSWVKGNDMWLHVRDYPGSYVFIKSRKGKTIPLEILIDAGTLALFYSKGKSNGKGDITYTQVKYLRRVKKGRPGQVIPTMNKNLYVTLDKKRLDSIKP